MIMNERLKTLALILERMDVLYLRAINVLESEKRSLIVLDYETLYAAIREKDEILAAIRGLDRDRLRIQDQFATVMDLDAEVVSLKTIGEALISQGASAEVDGRRLLVLRERLGKTLAALKEKLGSNRNFIERSIENLKGIAENLSEKITGKPGRSTRASGVYTGKARYEQNKSHAGHLIEKRL